jgi:hypothetical protein
MVENPRTAPGAHRLRPLNEPRPLSVVADERGRPVRVNSGQWAVYRGVERIIDRWRIDDEWWREPIARFYYAIELEDGRTMTIFQDLIKGTWWEQQY